MRITRGNLLSIDELEGPVTGLTVTEAGAVEIDIDTPFMTTISRIQIEDLRVLHHAIGIVLDFVDPELSAGARTVFEDKGVNVAAVGGNGSYTVVFPIRTGPGFQKVSFSTVEDARGYASTMSFSIRRNRELAHTRALRMVEEGA